MLPTYLFIVNHLRFMSGLASLFFLQNSHLIQPIWVHICQLWWPLWYIGSTTYWLFIKPWFDHSFIILHKNSHVAPHLCFISGLTIFFQNSHLIQPTYSNVYQIATIDKMCGNERWECQLNKWQWGASRGCVNIEGRFALVFLLLVYS